MIARSSSISKITLTTGAVAVAASALGSFVESGDISKIAKDTIPSITEASAPYTITSEGFDNLERQMELSYPIQEEWTEKIHKPELNRLIVKKATAPKKFTSADSRRLVQLQRMRRETLPPAMSYEQFIYEQERKEELSRLVDALMVYEQKYGALSNG